MKRAASASSGAARAAAAANAPGVPDNFTLTSSAQSMLNRPANDVIPAFTALAAHGQLPGQGEIITNVSLGDLTDASAAANPNDPCNFYASVFGPTTIVQGQPALPRLALDAADPGIHVGRGRHAERHGRGPVARTRTSPRWASTSR